jgi:hypothetical protein
MLTAVYDMSMDSRKAFLSVGGFACSAAGWTEFDRKWLDRLAQEGLNHFHMAEFADSVGAFEPFKKQERRQELLKDLLGIIASHAYRKFGVTVEVEAEDKTFFDRNKLEYAPNALALAGKLACGQALLRARAERLPVPEFVFGRGYLGRRKLTEQIRALTGLMPAFKPEKNSPQIRAYTPLQAAAILVYEMSQLNWQGMPQGSFSHPFQELNRMPGGVLRPRRARLRPSTLICSGNRGMKQKPR